MLLSGCGAKGSVGNSETVLELDRLVYGLGAGAGTVQLREELGIVDVQLMGRDANNCPVLAMQGFNVSGKLATLTAVGKNVIIDLVPV